MVDRLKDKAELKLEALFKSEPVPDLDFSKKVMGRVRRQIWIRRLVMPFALIVGGLIAVKPVSELIVTLSKVMTVLPEGLTSIPVNLPAMSADSIPQMTTIFVSGVIAAVALYFVRALAD